MLLSCLIGAYPENGYELYRTRDYWSCRELIDIANNGRINPEDKLQKVANTAFNDLLDRRAYKKHSWMYLPEKYNLWQIQAKSNRIMDGK